MSETIHLHRSSLKRNNHLFYLLIPSIVFAIVVYLYLTSAQAKNEHSLTYTSNKTDVLGTGTEQEK